MMRSSSQQQQFAEQELLTDEPFGELEPVAYFYDAMPTGVTVSESGRIFVNYPKWGDDVKFTVAEIIDGEAVAYPHEALNQPASDADPDALVSVQSVVVDPADRLWMLDTGSPLFKETAYGGPKLVGVELATNQVAKIILFPQDVALPTSYVNDVRFDLRRGEAGIAYITDSAQKGANGIIVVDLATGESWRRLNDHPSTKALQLPDFQPIVEGRPFLDTSEGASKQGAGMGADGIAITADGSRLFYCPLGSRRLYSVATDALVNRASDNAPATVIDEGDRGGASDGLESDADGYIYSTNYEHNAILRRLADDTGKVWETVVHDPRLLWADTMSIANDGYLYVTANQLHRQPRYQEGKDLRRKPYVLFRVKIDAQPVRLR
jgi:sugar lactone lactonase YvrE